MDRAAPSIPKRKLRVDLPSLEAAFGDLSFETHYYLDRKTGGLARIESAIRRGLEDLYEGLNRAGDENLGGFGSTVRRQPMPEETRQALLRAHEIESGLGRRYTPLPPAHPHLEVRDMEDFVKTLDDVTLREQLLAALCQPDHESRFADLLGGHPVEAEQWRIFRRERVKARVRYWLEEEGIEPLEN